MNVQEAAAGIGEEPRESLAPLLKKYIPGLTAAAVSALLNRATLPGGYFPLGAAFMAAVPQNYAAAAAVGGVMSCLTDGGVLTSMEGLRHVASLLAVCGIRWALGELRRVNRAKFYPFFAALAGILMTNTVINGTTGTVISYSTIYFIIEGVMAGLAAMFFSGACRAAERFGSGERLSRIASVSLIITLGAAAVPLCRLRLFGISPGVILLHAAVLLTASARREIGGATAGITGGCVTSLARYSMVQGAVIPVAALLAGYAAFYGRIFAASAYIACCFMGGMTMGRFDYVLVAEAAAGGIISCLIPPRYAERALSAAGFGNHIEHSDTWNADSSARLGDASEAISGICHVLGQVSDGLEKRSLPDDDSIYRRAFEGLQVVSRITYHDMEKKLMVYFRPITSQEELKTFDYEAIRSAIEDNFKAPNYAIRVVTTVNELMEKIKIAEFGLNDGVIEIAKFVYFDIFTKQFEGIGVINIYYERRDDKNALIFFCNDGRTRSIMIDPEVYASIEKRFSAVVNAIYTSRVCMVGRDWALRMIKAYSKLDSEKQEGDSEVKPPCIPSHVVLAVAVVVAVVLLLQLLHAV